MSEVVQGIAASPGIAIGSAHVVRWSRLEVPHATVPADRVDAEVERFHRARREAQRRTHELRDRVEARLGSVQAKIFDPQLLMLEDPDLIDGTLTYIRESSLTAERAFHLRVLEFRSQWLDVTHARVLDRIADLVDVQTRVLAALTDEPRPGLAEGLPEEPVVLVTHDLTPSRLIELDRTRVLGLATDGGTRTAHAAILARSLGIPAAVGLGDISRRLDSGRQVVLDGHRGRLVVEPSEAEKHWFRDQDVRVRATERSFERTAGLEPVTSDGTRIELLANLELPSDADTASAVGADGVGLFRTEFLVIGQSSVPDEEEQYAAFRKVAEIMDPRPVVIRTYDLGGDKFPMFLPPLSEENPFLGFRGVRIYREVPELFRNQVRAILRAAAHGNVRMMLPMVNSVDEVEEVHGVIEEVRATLEEEGIEHAAIELGAMLETPAAIAIAEMLADHLDFLCLGINDLTQYVLAVDRSNARLARYYDQYHPALLRVIRDALETAGRAGVPLSLCGEAASDALGVYLLVGLGLRRLSAEPSAIPELKTLIRAISLEEAARTAGSVFDLETGLEIRNALLEAVSGIVDFSELGATASLSRPD